MVRPNHTAHASAPSLESCIQAAFDWGSAEPAPDEGPADPPSCPLDEEDSQPDPQLEPRDKSRPLLKLLKDCDKSESQKPDRGEPLTTTRKNSFNETPSQPTYIIPTESACTN